MLNQKDAQANFYLRFNKYDADCAFDILWVVRVEKSPNYFSQNSDENRAR